MTGGRVSPKYANGGAVVDFGDEFAPFSERVLSFILCIFTIFTVDFGATDAACLSVETPNRVFDRFAHTDLEHCRCVDGSKWVPKLKWCENQRFSFKFYRTGWLAG